MARIPKHPTVNTLQTAIQLHQSGQLQQAESLYREVLRHQPQNADALHLLGVVAHQNGNNNLAVEMIEHALRINPNAAEFHNNCGEAYRAAGNLTKAILHYEKALSLNPDSAMTNNNLGLAFQALNIPGKAVPCYAQALHIDPGFAAAHYNLALAYQTQNRLDDAIYHLERALDLGHNFAAVHLSLANALQMKGRSDASITHYEKALDLNPEYPEAYNNLGNVYQAQERLDDAIACYVRALRLRPDYVMAHNNLANVFLKEGRLDAAIARYQKVLELKPDFAEAYYNLGNALHELGEAKRAMESYEMAIALNPGYAEAYHNIIIILRLQNRLDEAVDYCHRALKCRPNYPEAQLLLALTLQEQGRYTEAIHIFRSLLDIPDDYRMEMPADIKAGSGNECAIQIDATKITIATSIAPKNIDTQRRAIKSWRDLGFHVVSLNAQDEIDLLRPHFPELDFIVVTRDARKEFGRPFVYFDDVLEYFKSSDCKICGIANSDIHLRKEGLKEFIHNEARDSFMFGCRVEIPSPDTNDGEDYSLGYDYFFFDRNFLNIYPKESFCLGLPWWDYWAVLIPIQSGVTVKKVEPAVGYHVTHPHNWNYDYWYALGIVVAKHIGSPRQPSREHLHAYDKYTWSLIEHSSIKVSPSPCQ